MRECIASGRLVLMENPTSQSNGVSGPAFGEVAAVFTGQGHIEPTACGNANVWISARYSRSQQRQRPNRQSIHRRHHAHVWPPQGLILIWWKTTLIAISS